MNEEIERNLIQTIRRHFEELHEKIVSEFSDLKFDKELGDLRDDPVYSLWNFDREEYVLVRKIGRISISIGRRLGDIYDKLVREAIKSRFNLTQEQVAPKFGTTNLIELDARIAFNQINDVEKTRIQSIISSYCEKFDEIDGLGIEVRYNFNPNDSARLRKDVAMCELLEDNNLFPIFLIFSTSSPRQDAIGRLTRTGWLFFIGDESYNFLKEITKFDFKRFLIRDDIKQIIVEESDRIFKSLKDKYTKFGNIRIEDL
jgi:hypothetical protein